MARSNVADKSCSTSGHVAGGNIPRREGSVQVCTESHLPEDKISWGTLYVQGFGTALNAPAWNCTGFCELECQ